MTSILMSLMSGGYVPDTDLDPISDYELAEEQARQKVEAEAAKMTLEELYSASLKAYINEDPWLFQIYNAEIDKRNPAINIIGYSTLQDEPYQDDPEQEDRRKDYLENYAAIETDEFPF